MFKKLAVSGVITVAAAGMMLTATPASADTHTSGAFGILSGNQVFAPISIPISVCGNAVAVLGVAGAGCHGGANVIHHPRHWH